MIELYSYWRSSASFRVRIALEWKNLAYTLHPVHLLREGGQQHKPDYLALNPQGLVPCLVVDGKPIAQSMAILEFLEERYPIPSLLSKDDLERAQIRAFCQIIVSDTHPLNNLRVQNYLGELGVSEEQKKAWHLKWIQQGFETLETLLASRQNRASYAFGEQPTLADVCLIPQVYNALRRACPMDAYPRIQSIYHACMQLEAFKKAAPEQQLDAE